MSAENGFVEYISPTRRRSPKMATASLTELKGREVSTVEVKSWGGVTVTEMGCGSMSSIVLLK